jgi:hypothetical protein
MIDISYCITVCNELDELIRLTNFLLPRIRPTDEVLIQYDLRNVTFEVVNYLNVLKTLEPTRVTVISKTLNDEFADFKNNLKNHARGIYIVQLDADEMLSESFLEDLPEIIEENRNTDLFFLPRINTVDGITEKHVKQWGWKITKNEQIIDEKQLDKKSDYYKYLKKLGYIIEDNDIVKFYKPIIQFPDYQTRIYRRTSEVKWEGAVHETIVGYNTFAIFPGVNDYCILHHKTIEKQEKQNKYYETI